MTNFPRPGTCSWPWTPFSRRQEVACDTTVEESPTPSRRRGLLPRVISGGSFNYGHARSSAVCTPWILKPPSSPLNTKKDICHAGYLRYMIENRRHIKLYVVCKASGFSSNENNEPTQYFCATASPTLAFDGQLFINCKILQSCFEVTFYIPAVCKFWILKIKSTVSDFFGHEIDDLVRVSLSEKWKRITWQFETNCRWRFLLLVPTVFLS